jgi:hypothetical protein
MAKSPQKPPLSLVSSAISGEIEAFDTPPRPLGSHGQRLWTSVQAEYQISDVGGREILCQCAELLDRAERLREEIDRDGEIIRTKAGPRVHPGINQETHLRTAIGKMLERLGLNLEPVKPHGGQSRAIGWTGGR